MLKLKRSMVILMNIKENKETRKNRINSSIKLNTKIIKPKKGKGSYKRVKNDR